MLHEGIDCDTPEDEEAEVAADESVAVDAQASVCQASPEENSDSTVIGNADGGNETEPISLRPKVNLRPRMLDLKCEEDRSREWLSQVRVKDEPNSAEEIEPGSPFIVANSPEQPRSENDKEYMGASMFDVLPSFTAGRHSVGAHDFSALHACDSHHRKNMIDLAAFMEEKDPIWID